MNYDDYVNTLEYPTKREFTTRFWYKAGKVIAQRGPDGQTIYSPEYEEHIDLDTCTTEAHTDEEALRKARVAYQEENGRLREKFRQDFFKELEIEDHPKREKLYAKAYDMGHSAGYAEVMNYGYDLVELIKD